METYKYLIPGQPVSFTKAHYAESNGFNTTKEIKLIWEITLQGQHEGKPLIATEVEVFFEFFFDETLRAGQHYANRKLTPTIPDLIKYACEMATGVIWKDSRLVLISHAEKHYSKQPRTEMTIIKLPTTKEYIGNHGKKTSE